jgi:transcriptional regulator with XRE-family HTH domain
MAKVKKKVQAENNYSAAVKKLGKRIKALRMERGYSSAMKFAYDNDLSAVQMVRWEQGRNMTFETLLKLAEAFGITITDLLKDF